MRLWIMALACLVMIVGGCDGRTDADRQQAEKTAALMKEAEAQVGMPAIVNFQERKLAKLIIEQCDREDLVCYAYIVNKMQGKLVFIGKCIGYGLPYAVQYTNPERLLWPNSRDSATMPQPDPSGLFKPSSLSATWLMMLDKNGTPRPVYLEPEIVVSPFPLH